MLIPVDVEAVAVLVTVEVLVHVGVVGVAITPRLEVELFVGVKVAVEKVTFVLVVILGGGGLVVGWNSEYLGGNAVCASGCEVVF